MVLLFANFADFYDFEITIFGIVCVFDHEPILSGVGAIYKQIIFLQKARYFLLY